LDKAPDAFRTISEVADEINVPQHVLRFWESRFTQIKPLKRGGGRRYYRPDDVDLLRGVRHLLYGEGYTIRGVQRILREEGLAFVQDVWRVEADAEADIDASAPEDDDGRMESGNDAPRLQEPSFFAVGTRAEVDTGGHADERREPSLTAPPLPAVEPAPAPIGLHGEERSRLRAALDELVACRHLIDAALSGTPQRHGGEAGENAA
jgi:DNA-binding transcriptional MerR regulator